MVALRLSTDSRPSASRRRAVRREESQEERSSSRSLLTLDAMPVDAWQHARIERAIQMAVERVTDEGVEARLESPVVPGRRFALGFPDSPFLPAPGTVVRVEECVAQGTGYRVQLAFEAYHAA